ncbi:YggT family protein [Sporosarcina sp. P13]|uniref:YggT family protein n=1 Tax=Sporosarcina sp. P13 TaxID=2048263 RepID=UPI0018ED2363|nr:YggT family protein [Sporosarcina sp. P13]
MDAILFNIVLFIRNAVQLYSFLLIIYILMSWVPSTKETKFGQFLAKVTEPYLGFFRKFIPPLGMIDISPIAALFALQLINRGIVQLYFMIRGLL